MCPQKLGSAVGLQLGGGKSSFSTVIEWIRSIETKATAMKREAVSL